MGGGLLMGLSNRDAARFAFLLATPIIGAAGILKLPELFGPDGRTGGFEQRYVGVAGGRPWFRALFTGHVELASIGKSRAEGPQSAIPDRLFEMGRYGQKTGAGWYKYAAPGSRDRTPDPLIEQLADEEAKKRGITRKPIADAEILSRIMVALANEGARVLEDGYATRPGDIDVIYCYGFGFPRHRGGPMFYADTVGLPTVLAKVKEYRARFGDYWQPAPLIERMVAEGRSFYGKEALA